MRVETDTIISLTVSLIMFVKTFKTDFYIFFNGNIIMCLTSHWQRSHWLIIFSIRLSQVFYNGTIPQWESGGEHSKLISNIEKRSFASSCVLGVRYRFYLFLQIFLLDLETAPTVWYFFLSFCWQVCKRTTRLFNKGNHITYIHVYYIWHELKIKWALNTCLKF